MEIYHLFSLLSRCILMAANFKCISVTVDTIVFEYIFQRRYPRNVRSNGPAYLSNAKVSGSFGMGIPSVLQNPLFHTFLRHEQHTKDERLLEYCTQLV